MANEVYANGMEIACKAAAGKSVAAFPDTCLSPPSPPAGPVPIPYPNTAYASDTTNGSTTVMISGQEVMLKDQSTFKKSTGDEAATKSLGMGVVTHALQGEASFIAWSMDVKVEGQNVDRHLDPMLHNEQCNPANTPPMTYVDASAFGTLEECAEDKEAMKKACKGKDPCPGVLNVPKQTQREQVDKAPSKRMQAFAAHADTIADVDGSRTAKAAAAAEAEANGSKCVQKSRCYLRPYEPGTKQDGCCPGQTGHHIPPKACFKSGSGYLGKYSPSSALCVCLEGMNQHCGSHGKNHAAIESLAEEAGLAPGDTCSVEDYNKLCAETVEAQCGCDKECIEAQLNAQAKDHKVKNVKHVDTNSSADISEFEDNMLENTELDVPMDD
jgi:Toxin PAAR-like domain